MTTGPSSAIAIDVAVVGAGPAGLAAAVAAADGGRRVALVDAEPGPGGQFWRHPARDGDDPHGVSSGAPAASNPLREAEVSDVHHDLRTFRRLRGKWRAHVAAGRGRDFARTEVWAASAVPGGRSESRVVLHLVDQSGDCVEVRARSAILATGAYDLQLPFDGWDLPGVMTAGGVQSLLKGHAVLAGRRVLVAGTGPFLLSVASGLARSGARVAGVVETARAARWARLARVSAGQRAKITEALGYAWDFVRWRVPVRIGWTVLRAEPNAAGELARVTIAPVSRDGTAVETRSRVIEVDVLAVGWGFVPRLELATALGCETRVDAGGIPVVVADAAQRSTVAGVFLAGEICGVGGAALAVVEGEIAGAIAAAEIPAELSATRRAALARQLAPALRRRAKLRRFATGLARSFPAPVGWAARLSPETVVCRCEEVSVAEILAAARRHGARDARTLKLLARPGMGWCQGRICGYATEVLVADAAGAAPAHRAAAIPVAVPVRLAALSARQAPEDCRDSREDPLAPGRTM